MSSQNIAYTLMGQVMGMRGKWQIFSGKGAESVVRHGVAPRCADNVLATRGQHDARLREVGQLSSSIS